MEKAFKYMCLFMTAIIVFASLLMPFAALKSNGKKVDTYGCSDIVENIKNYKLNMTSVIYTQNSGGEWIEYQRIHGTENRIWVDLNKAPDDLIDAIIAIEDQRFFEHQGVDWKRTISAFINYLPFVELYSSNQGGSTITQQLIKNITSDNDKSAKRKLREIARALGVEKALNKNTILEAYINTISLGNGICGVQVAANYYFNKDVEELTLAECASIAAITKNPSAYNPYTKPEGNLQRRRLVLKKMLELGKITRAEYDKAYKEEVEVDKTQKNDFEIPVNNYFVDTLIEEIINDLSQEYGYSTDTASAMLYNGGCKIYCTLDSEIQNTMEEVYLNKEKYFKQTSRSNKEISVQSAMTIMDYSGNIKGIVGGVGEKTVNRGLNRATDSPRQPGSTMKPLGVYTLAIENDNVSYSTVMEDKPIQNYFGYGKPGPNEWYGEYAGNMTIKTAVERSANTIPCWLLKDKIGIQSSFNFLTDKLKLNHLTEEDKNLASLALGGCQYGVTTTESAAAYAIFGNGGVYHEPTTYVKVLDSNDDVVLESKSGRQVIKQSTATIMNRLLQNVVYGSAGTGKGIANYSSMPVYAKTGTSSESNDLWMVAGTPYYVGSVWYGFDNPEQIYNSGAAATVWRVIMKEIHSELEKKDFEYSDDVVKRTYCVSSGELSTETCKIDIGYYVSNSKIQTCDGVHYTDEENIDASTENITDETSSTDQTPSEDNQTQDESQSDLEVDENNSSEDDVSHEDSDNNSEVEDNQSSDEVTGEETQEGDDNSQQDKTPHWQRPNIPHFSN